jgi:hypothetical protein
MADMPRMQEQFSAGARWRASRNEGVFAVMNSPQPLRVFYSISEA